MKDDQSLSENQQLICTLAATLAASEMAGDPWQHGVVERDISRLYPLLRESVHAARIIVGFVTVSG